MGFNSAFESLNTIAKDDFYKGIQMTVQICVYS